MARNRRIESEHDAYYHVVSRCNNRCFLFESASLKDRICEIMKRAAEFSGVELRAHCLMDNHFHLVIKVTKPEEDIPPEEVMRRIGVLKGESELERLQTAWKNLGANALESRLAPWRRRMHSLPEFVKTFKELVNIACKAEAPHTGSIFEGRYHSTLIEDGRYLADCIRYVEYNPIRAGLVNRAADYRWSSKNAAKPNECAPQAGSVPARGVAGGWVTKRIGQLSQGMVFGSREFVANATWAFGNRFTAGSVPIRQVSAGEARMEAFSTHGHRVVKTGCLCLSREKFAS